MKTAIQLGREAFNDGKPVHDNPYDPMKEILNYTSWRTGYAKAAKHYVRDCTFRYNR